MKCDQSFGPGSVRHFRLGASALSRPGRMGDSRAVACVHTPFTVGPQKRLSLRQGDEVTLEPGGLLRQL